MFTRLPVGSLSAALTLSAAACCGGATAASAATALVTYDINNHDQQVTVRDGAGRALLTRHLATPTLRAVITENTTAAKPAPPRLSLTLEDESGLRLWSTRVPVAAGMHSMQLSAKWDSKAGGTRLGFAFSTQAPTGPEHTAPSSVICVIGADGRLVSMKAGGKGFDLANTPHGFSFAGPDGTVGSLNMTNTGGTLDFGGTKLSVKIVKRDGKDYFSFPLNGHTVLVQTGCHFHVDGGGDLTVSAPAATASK